MDFDKNTIRAMKEDIQKYIENRILEIKELEKEFCSKFVPLEEKGERYKDLLPFVVAGIDGGVAKETFICFELAFIRPAGTVLRYFWDENTASIKCKRIKAYNKFGTEINLEKWGKEEDEISSILNFTCKRVLHEFGLAKRICENERPDMVLLHGPLFPHYLKDSIQNQSNEAEDFQRLGRIIASLLEFQFSTNSFICGVVEDSRGRTFVKSVIDSDKFSDIEVLSVLMPENSITLPVKHEGMENLKRISKDFEKIENLSVFYYRPYLEDMPIRIEFVPKEDPLEESLRIAEMLRIQMFPCKRYAMPWALVEADKMAKITEEESRILFNALLPPFSKEIMLRRKKRMI